MLLSLLLLVIQLHRASADGETGSGASLSSGVASPVTAACNFVTADGIEFEHLDRLRSFYVRRTTRSEGRARGNKLVEEARDGLSGASFAWRSRSCILSAAELILATSNQSDYICQ